MQRKREKAERIKHLSQDIREQNLAAAESSPTKQSQSTRAQQSPASIRERMQEYARNVQKAAMYNRPPSPNRMRWANSRPFSSCWSP